MEQGGRKKNKYLVLIFSLLFCLVSTSIYKHIGTSKWETIEHNNITIKKKNLGQNSGSNFNSTIYQLYGVEQITTPI